MATVLLVLVVVLVVAALVFGVVTLLTGEDPGLAPAEPDGRALPLPNNRSLTESDLKAVRFDLAVRGYRMAQVDRVLRRTAYDLGYKDEMIAVLEAEVIALREGRGEDAELLRKARESAANPAPVAPAAPPTPNPWPSGSAPVPLDIVSNGRDDGGAFDREDAGGASAEPGVVDEDDDGGDGDPSRYTGPGRLARRSAVESVELPDRAAADAPAGAEEPVEADADEAATADVQPGDVQADGARFAKIQTTEVSFAERAAGSAEDVEVPTGDGQTGDVQSGDARTGDGQADDVQSGDARTEDVQRGDVQTADVDGRSRG